MHDQLESLANEFWELEMQRSPLRATMLGDHRYDDQVSDYSAEFEASYVAKIRRLSGDVTAIDPAGLNPAERVTRGMLIQEIHSVILSSEAHSSEMATDQMLSIHSQLMRALPLMTAPEPAHAHMMVDRYAALGNVLDQASERFREGVAAGHTSAATNIERSLSQIDGYLSSPADNDLLGGVTGPADWDGEPAWRAAIADQLTNVVRPALARYRNVLADELLPTARSNDQPGLTWLDDGAAIYDKYVELFTSLDLTAEEIHKIGRIEVEQILPPQYEEIGGRAFGGARFPAVIERLKTDQQMMYRDVDQMSDLAYEAMARALAAVPEWFGRTPKAECVVQPVPDEIARDVPAAYYSAPAADGSRPGTYFLNMSDPTERNMFEAESIAFHEAIPGHHFQIALAAELDGLPMFQRYATNTAFIEGWGLYTERLADEMGLYSSDIQRLGMLAADSWRACRLVVDTGLHALGWTRQQAIDYMTKYTPVRFDDIAVEVDRYIGMPGQALAYKIGQREIFRLRAAAESALEDRFDIRQFHDVCLTSGSVTLPILGELVAEWITSSGEAG